MIKIFKDSAVNLVLLLVAVLALLFAAFSADGVTVVPAPSRVSVVPESIYKPCSPYTPVGEACLWVGGMEIPMMSTGPSRFITMVTLIMPPTNPEWDLFKGDFFISLDYVYKNDCKNNVITYQNTASLYYNDSYCK